MHPTTTRISFCGSSPQMRGALFSVLLLAGFGGDHPRRCGEHMNDDPFLGPWQGSSPQMRGAQSAYKAGQKVSGIIPADAGSTRCKRQTGRPCGDHPRRCGEHNASPTGCRPCDGSSPQMRGAPLLPTTTARSLRIIPADAGSTTGRST